MVLIEEDYSIDDVEGIIDVWPEIVVQTDEGFRALCHVLEYTLERRAPSVLLYLLSINQNYPRLKQSLPLPIPCSNPRSSM